MRIYPDVMVDLETLGKCAGCAVISIGAVAFDINLPEDQWGKFYMGPINRTSCYKIGLDNDQDTLNWWRNQNAEARRVFDQSLRKDTEGIKDAILAFNRFFPPGAKLWGNGSDFDNPILSTIYRKLGISQPWAYYDGRCYRTMKNMFSKIEKPEFIGVRHNAMDDAMNQTRHLVKILQEVKKWQ